MFIILLFLAAVGSSSDAAEHKQTDRLRLGDPEASDIAKCIGESDQPDGFAETWYVDHRSIPSLRPEEERRGYLVFSRHWMDLIFPSSIPERAEIIDRLGAFGAPGEYEPLTFCVRTLRELKGLEVKASELVSQSGGRLAAPEVQIVRCAPRAWRSEEPLYEGGPVGIMNMPTYLEKTRLVDVVAGRTVQFWLTVKIENDARPGMYQGEIRISHEQGQPYGIKIKLEVLPVSLVEPSQTLGFWDYQRPYKGEIGTIGQVYQMMSEHGMNAIFARASHYEYDKKTDRYDFSRYISIDNAEKVTVTLDGSSLETSMEAAKRAGFKYVIYHPFLQELVSTNVEARYDRRVLEEQSAEEVTRVLKRFEGTKDYETIKTEITNFNQKYSSVYSQAYADLYVDILREILRDIKRRNWPTPLISSWDEASSNHRRNKTVYPFVLRHLELRKRAGAITILNHCSPFMEGEYGEYIRATMKYLDIAMPAPRLSLDPKQTSGYNATLSQLVQAFAKEGIITFNYSLSGQTGGVFPDLSVVRFSGGFFFHTLGRGVRGNIDYIYFRPEGDPYNPVDDFHPVKQRWSHERLWFFPPREQADRLGGRSLALAAKREGFDDLRYLQTLDVLIDQAQAKTESPEVQQGARIAAARRKRILESFMFTDKALDSNLRKLWSRWDTVRVTEGKKPTVSGHFRLANGWTFSTYDRSRRAFAQEIIKLREALTFLGEEPGHDP